MEQTPKAVLGKRKERFLFRFDAVPGWILLEIKRVAGQTPPGPGGAQAGQFPQFPWLLKRSASQLSYLCQIQEVKLSLI
jgi:hypothetical protein